MNIEDKLKILSDAAKYDVSCSSSGSSRKNTKNGLGNASAGGICHSFTADGRCISLLKILLNNYCIYDCSYCINRLSNDVPRAAFTPEEVALLTINFYRRNYIEGLFLSSAVFNNPNYTMEFLLKTVMKLRNDYRFNGYIHLKAIPGADLSLIKAAGCYVDRMSVNIELPSNESLTLLAPQKSKDSIFKPMSFIGNESAISKQERRISTNAPLFVPAGQSTQLIVGATPDSDHKIIKLSENLYNKFNLKRVYYSAYVPVSKSPKLPMLESPPLLREHRLYQADWLLRFYNFTAEELLTPENPNFDVEVDPKTQWALNNIANFPVEINTAPSDLLLRVPGIGVRSVQKICSARIVHKLDFDAVKKLGVVIKRARFFITCKGKYYGNVPLDPQYIRPFIALKDSTSRKIKYNESFEQLSLFNSFPAVCERNDIYSSLTGEL